MILYELKELDVGAIILCPLCKGLGFLCRAVLTPGGLGGHGVEEKVCYRCGGKGRVVIRHDKLREGS